MISIEANSDVVPAIPESAPLNILSTATALQRAVIFLQAVLLNHLLLYSTTTSYRKVMDYFINIYINLKKIIAYYLCTFFPGCRLVC